MTDLNLKETMSILTQAEKIINGDRQEEYGPAKESFERVASVWSAILGQPVTAEQAALCMIGLKLVRCSYKITLDSIVDICGYAGIIEKILFEEELPSSYPEIKSSVTWNKKE